MKEKIIKIISFTCIGICIIFALKTIYLLSMEFIKYTSIVRITGVSIASILSILVCLIVMSKAIKSLIK